MMFTKRGRATQKNALRSRSNIAGFTVLEMVITLAIVVFATSLVMLRYASFDSSVLLSNTAYEIAFDLRETQSLAISVRGARDDFREEYGLYFDMTSPNQYILFQDIGDDSDQSAGTEEVVQFDAAAGEAIGQPVIIDPRFEIVDICATRVGNSTQECYSDGNAYPTHVSIAFARPDFDALLYAHNMGVVGEVEIVLGTGEGENQVTRTVQVKRSGLITVKNESN